MVPPKCGHLDGKPGFSGALIRPNLFMLGTPDNYLMWETKDGDYG
jgi:hypothetical protein